MSETSADRLGERYRLVSERMSFPFGALWEAEDDQGARTLVLRFHRDVEDPRARVDAAIAEATRVESVQVVPWADGGVDDQGLGWLAAPMFGPWSLREHIERNEGLPPIDAAPILHQVARTIAVGEAAGVLHHALTSELIRLVPIPEGGYAVKLYGYGLRELLPPYKPLRKNAAYVGVPDYMAPELCAGKPADGLADVYAVGILLYEAIRGRPPFAPTFASASASTTLKRQIFEKPLALHVRYGGIPHIKAYEAVALKALTKTSNRRQPSMLALEEELAALITEEMRATIVPVASAASRPATTSRRLRTQVLPSIPAGAERASVGMVPGAKVNLASESDEPAQGVEIAEAEPDAPDVTGADDGAPEPDSDSLHTVTESKRKSDSTLVFVGLGPKVRELARARGGALGADDEDDEDDVAEAEDASTRDDSAAAASASPDGVSTGDGASTSAGAAEAKADDEADGEDEDEDGDGDGEDRRPRRGKRSRKRKKRRTGAAKRPDTGTRPEMEAVPASRTAPTALGLPKVARSEASTNEEEAAGTGASAVVAPAARVRRRQDRTATAAAPAGDDGALTGTDEQEGWFVSSADELAKLEEQDGFIVQKKPPYFWYAAVPLVLVAVVLIYFLTQTSEPAKPQDLSPSETVTPTPPAGEREGARSDPGAEHMAVAPSVAPMEGPGEEAARPAPADPGPADDAETPTAVAPGDGAPPAEVPPGEQPTEQPTAEVPPGEPTAEDAAAAAAAAAMEAAEARYLNGLRARTAGDLAKAKAELEAALALDAGHEGAQEALAQVEATLREQTAARAAADKPAPTPAPRPTPRPPATPAEKPPTPPATAEKPPAPAESPEESFREQSQHFIRLGLEAYKNENFRLAAGYFERAHSLDSENKLAARYLKMAREQLEAH